ncbi:TorA maturation chaperone TorD [Paucimonas lemoignei]|uniref:TorA maturation chaperone TorD n=1 Tax=Paucimonas lemoignei TaxID=29443 RepID=A0A4R3HUW5_PAULE|nr:molecular chaperone TorD family protein [Paucimonas lemoignei]TCS35981.1 TorA maturation chaperone TorD [Paucimonas lemoignei]
MQASHAHCGAEAMPGQGMVLSPLPQEEQARADFYALLARLWIAAPDGELLTRLASADMLGSQASQHPLDSAWEKLVLAAGILEPDAVEEEFNALFISVGTPKINPYASLYLAGFLNEKPLAGLRDELTQLGLARIGGVGETEDHLGALCEVMRLMIAGAPGVKRQSLHRQKLFFEKHIASWSRKCCDDIRVASEANFYRLLADFTEAFFAVDAEAFDMESEMVDH